MKHALPKQRKLFSIHWSLLRKFADIRPSHKRLLTRSRQDQNAHALIVFRVRQRIAQLFHRLPVQRIQHLRSAKRNPSNLIFLLINQILVSHLLFFLCVSQRTLRSALSLFFAFLCALCDSVANLLLKSSWPQALPDPRNHKIPSPLSCHSIPPAPFS